MKIKDYQKKIRGKGKVNMSLYDINKSIMAQLPEYKNDQIRELETNIDNWAEKDEFELNKFFMLLCRDINYYTIFYLEPEKAEFRTLGEGVTGLLYDAGYTIHSEEVQDDHCEIWVKKDNEAYAFMLFPYDQGVVYYG